MIPLSQFKKKEAKLKRDKNKGKKGMRGDQS
jgi:hypothetical protein